MARPSAISAPRSNAADPRPGPVRLRDVVGRRTNHAAPVGGPSRLPTPSSDRKARAQGALGWVALVLVLASVLPQGGNQPVVWMLLATALLGLCAGQTALLSAQPTPQALRRAGPLALLYGLVLAWGLVQVALPVPERLAHPIWQALPQHDASVPVLPDAPLPPSGVSISSGLSAIDGAENRETGIHRVGRNEAGAAPPGLPEAPAHAPLRIGADPGQGVHAVLRLASYGMVAWIFAAAALRTARAWAFVRVIALSSAALASYGIVAAYGGAGGATGALPVSATFVNRNAYATYAAFGMLANAALFLRLATPRGADGSGDAGGMHGALEGFFGGAWRPALGALLCGAAVALTQSRGGGVAALLGLLTLLFCAAAPTRGSAHNRTALLAIGIALIGFVALALGGGTAARLLAGGEGVAVRLSVYGALLEEIPQRPWLGQGLGAFHDTFRAHVPLEAAQREWAYAHSSYLENAYELGLPATAVFYLVLGCLGLRCARGVMQRQRDALLPALALAVFVTGAAHSLVDFSLQMPGCAVLFAALLGIGWAQSFRGPDRRPG